MSLGHIRFAWFIPKGDGCNIYLYDTCFVDSMVRYNVAISLHYPARGIMIVLLFDGGLEMVGLFICWKG